MLNAIENEILFVKHTCNTANLHKNMASTGKMMEEQNLDFVVFPMS